MDPLLSRTMRLAGWGRFGAAECRTIEPATTAEAARACACAPAITRGNGRSYGDSSFAPSFTILAHRLDRMLAFDPANSTLTCEAGTLLSDIVAAFTPRGWFPPVTPGTKFVTIGGMIAADVHGKNHHVVGSFCDHVIWLDLALGDGTTLRCSRTEHPDLFAATCGGMGLTGIILRAAFTLIRIESVWMEQTIARAPNLESAMAIFEAGQDHAYSVAWIDCLATGPDLGRSIVYFGEHAAADRLPIADRTAPRRLAARASRRVPIDLPQFVLNQSFVRAFNALYYRRARQGISFVDVDRYFYPLDALLEWNRIYGKTGFVQYQCVIPRATAGEALTRLLGLAGREGSASFLAVLKLMGRGSFGYLSFPMEGYTLALDFPATPSTLRLLDRCDAIVAQHGGRIYLAKDARTSRAMIEAGYPRLASFRDVRRRYGVDRRFGSAQSSRLGL